MIRIEHLSYRFQDGTEGLRDINLRIKTGEIVALLGRNGSGKSTLVRHLNGLLRPSEGTVFVKGLDTANSSNLREIRQAVGMVFQNPATQFVGTTLEEDVAFGPENLALPGKEILERVDRALAEVGLSSFKTQAPKALSGGQQQCAAIACVLAMKPECIVFDEVTSMLDLESRELVMQIIRKLHRKGRTLVYVTHRLEEVLPADRVIVMDRGKIVLTGRPKEVFKAPELAAFGIKKPPVVELLNGLETEGLTLDWKKLTSTESLAEEIWASLSRT